MQTELTQIQGNIKLMVIREATGEFFRSPSDIFKFMRAEAKIDRECAWVLHVNGKNQIIEKELVSMGTINQALLEPREIYRKAIINSSAAIAIVHNHPSGDFTPSQADIRCSERLKAASEILNVTLLDFIVIGRSYTSFADERIGGFK